MRLQHPKSALLSGLIMVQWLGLSGASMAASEPQFSFHIASQPLEAALVAFALQSEISISTQKSKSCGPVGRAVHGLMTRPQALERLLAGSGCGFRFLDDTAIEIIPVSSGPSPMVAPPRLAKVQAPQPSPNDLIVTATRRPTPVDRLAYGVSASDQHTLGEQAVHDTTDLAMIMPAMTLTNLGAGRNKILLRGLSDGPLTGRTQSMVGIYLGGVRITYNAPDPDLRLTDIAQVEVLRGPQGALYGSGSLGGIVQILPNAPEPSERFGWISTTAGLAKGVAPSGVVEAMANLPLFDHRGAVRLAAWNEVEGGYIDDLNLKKDDVNQTVRSGLRLSTLLELNSRWTIKADLTQQNINARDTQYAVSGAGTFSRRNQVREPHDNDFMALDFSAKGSLDRADFNWTIATIRHDVRSRYDASLAPPFAAPPGPVAFDDRDQIGTLITEASLLSKPEAPVQWLAGAFWARTRQDIGLSQTNLAVPSMLVFDELRRDDLDEGALFGEIAAPLTRDLTLTLGGRAFVSRLKMNSQIFEASIRQTFGGHLSNTGLAPKLVLAWQARPNVLVYIQATEGYRSGGFNTTAQVRSASAPPTPSLSPTFSGDELWSLETGGHVRFLDGRLNLRFALFDARWKTIESDQLSSIGLPYTANIGDGRNQGLELETRYHDGPLALTVAALLNSPELERVNPAFASKNDLSLAGAPNSSFNATAHYTLPLDQGRSLELDARAAYVGLSHLTFGGGLSPRMGGYATGRLAATLAQGPWRLCLALDNPTNTAANSFAYGNPFSIRLQPQLTPLRPRTLMFTATVSY